MEEVNNDKVVIQEWIQEENARLKYEGQMTYAREEGSETTKLELIKKMLDKGTDYEYISEVTGKSIDEIKEIENNIEK